MGDYLGGYFSQKLFDSEIYDILIGIPEVSGYLATEWTRFKNNKRNKVPKDAKMNKIWAKKEIFDNKILRDLAESLILGKYNVILNEKGHITKETARPIKERKKIDTSEFYYLLNKMRDNETLKVLSENVEEEVSVPRYFTERIQKQYAIEPRKSIIITSQMTPLEQKAAEAKGEVPQGDIPQGDIKVSEPQSEQSETEGLFIEETKEEKLIRMANELIVLSEKIKETLRS